MISIDRYLTVFICINTGISPIIYKIHHNTIIIYAICNLYNLICIYIRLPTACLYKSYMYLKYTYIYIGNNVPVHLIPYTYYRTYLSDIDLMHYSLHAYIQTRYIYIYMYVCMYVCIYIYRYTYIHIYTTYIITYIRIYTYTYIHIYILYSRCITPNIIRIPSTCCPNCFQPFPVGPSKKRSYRGETLFVGKMVGWMIWA